MADVINDLQEMEYILSREKHRFDEIKSSMEYFFEDFFFGDDPVLLRFKNLYEEKLEPIEKKMFPAVDVFRQFLHQQIDILETI